MAENTKGGGRDRKTSDIGLEHARKFNLLARRLAAQNANDKNNKPADEDKGGGKEDKDTS